MTSAYCGEGVDVVGGGSCGDGQASRNYPEGLAYAAYTQRSCSPELPVNSKMTVSAAILLQLGSQRTTFVCA